MQCSFLYRTVSLVVEYGYDFDVDRIVRDKGDPRQYAIKNELPMILWWTPFTGDMGSVKRCGQDECFLTQDRSLFGHKLNEVMLFYGTSFNESDLPLPRKGVTYLKFSYETLLL